MLQEAVINGIFPFLNPNSRFHWVHLLFFLITSAVIYFFWKKRHSTSRGAPSPDRRFSDPHDAVRGFWGWLFPKGIYGSRFFVSDLYFVITSGFLLSFVPLWQNPFKKEMVANLVSALPGERVAHPDAFLLHAAVIYVAVDLGWWIAHYLSHKSTFLWEFHKVHHSPTGLNPFTASRFHFVERALIVLVQLACAILADAAMSYFVMPVPNSAYAANVTASLLVIGFIINIPGWFRHSHVWWSFGRWPSEILVSPAMHQIHHSLEEHHRDKNFARDFSIWDRLFGTIYIPLTREEFRSGLPHDESPDYERFWQSLYRPFVRVGNMLFGKTGRYDGRTIE